MVGSIVNPDRVRRGVVVGDAGPRCVDQAGRVDGDAGRVADASLPRRGFAEAAAGDDACGGSARSRLGAGVSSHAGEEPRLGSERSATRAGLTVFRLAARRRDALRPDRRSVAAACVRRAGAEPASTAPEPRDGARRRSRIGPSGSSGDLGDRTAGGCASTRLAGVGSHEAGYGIWRTSVPTSNAGTRRCSCYRASIARCCG
jgi:hypothetical protein